MTLVLVTAVAREIETTLPGLSPHATVHRRFGELVTQAGGIPVFAGAEADPVALAERVDAVVVNGGGDVGPERYGAAAHPETHWVEPDRDEFELTLVREALDRGVPVLGVCRGIHVLNVALGGTLVQHLPEVTEVEHFAAAEFARPVHSVRLEPGSRAARVYGREEIEVNSAHHQAVAELGAGLRVSGRAADGTIEVIESEETPAIGVQWHPELLSPEYDEVQGLLFRALVEQGRRR